METRPYFVHIESGAWTVKMEIPVQITQRELRRVVECLAGGLTQGLVLVDDRRLVERGFNIER